MSVWLRPTTRGDAVAAGSLNTRVESGPMFTLRMPNAVVPASEVNFTDRVTRP